MINKKIEKALNEQVAMECFSSAQYLAMAAWLENKGFEGTGSFLYNQSDEERTHMLKLFHYILDAGGKGVSPGIKEPKSDFKNLHEVFENIYIQEQKVSQSINHLVNLSHEEKDHTTHNFLQWYVAEQLEEEALFRSILDKLKMIGDNGGALYVFDKDMKDLVGQKNILKSQSTGSKI
jgi:ferritin